MCDAGEGERQRWVVIDVAIHAHGDGVAGMGHIMRQLVLARELRGRGVAVAFVTDPDSAGGRRVASDGFPVVTRALTQVAISDVPCGPTPAVLADVKRTAGHVVVFIGSGQILSHPGAVTLCADLVIEQSVMTPDGTVPQTVGGGDYLLIDPRYAAVRGAACGPIVVCYGGRDFLSLTERTVAALQDVGRELRVVTGPAREPLASGGRGVTAIHAPASLVEALDGASLYVGAFGMSALEALAGGVPVVCNGWSDDHVRSVEALEGLGVAVSLGRAEHFNAGELRYTVDNWKWAEWPVASAAARGLCDGQGARRCADAVMGLMR